jgi:hypothetical protein
LRTRTAFCLLIALLGPTLLIKAQTKDNTEIPKAMRLCIGKDLWLRLAFDGNEYVAHLEANNAPFAEYWMIDWTPKNVRFFGRSLNPDGSGFRTEATFTGTVDASGTSVTNGVAKWNDGTVKSGEFPFTLQWDKSEANMAPVKRLVPNNPNAALISTSIQVIDPSKVKPIYGELHWSLSKSHPDVVIPPLAGEEFASFPEDERAILRPSHDAKLMTIESLKAPCSEAKNATNGDTALEVAKFAIRDLEYNRADCWLNQAYALKSQLAPPLMGLANLEGWGVPKNPAEAFRIFTVQNDIWSLYFREQCLLKGIGTAKNDEEAKKLDLKIQMSLSGEYVLESIGLDKVANQRNQLEAQLDTHPPTKPSTSCRQAFPNEVVPANERGANNDVCKTSEVVDRDAIKEALDNFQPSEPQICTTDAFGIQTCL